MIENENLLAYNEPWQEALLRKHCVSYVIASLFAHVHGQTL